MKKSFDKSIVDSIYESINSAKQDLDAAWVRADDREFWKRFPDHKDPNTVPGAEIEPYMKHKNIEERLHQADIELERLCVAISGPQGASDSDITALESLAEATAAIQKAIGECPE